MLPAARVGRQSLESRGPTDPERKTVLNAKSARQVWIGALTLYLLWIAALTGMAVISSAPPATAKVDRSPAPIEATP